MEDEKNIHKQSQCLSCLGSGELYDFESDDVTLCNYCKGTGKASDEDNECFLESINYN